MGGPRGQKEIGRVQTQRYSSAFITTILLEAREGVTERDKKIDRKTKQIISEHNKWQDNKVVGCVFPFCIRKGWGLTYVLRSYFAVYVKHRIVLQSLSHILFYFEEGNCFSILCKKKKCIASQSNLSRAYQTGKEWVEPSFKVGSISRWKEFRTNHNNMDVMQEHLLRKKSSYSRQLFNFQRYKQVFWFIIKDIIKTLLCCNCNLDSWLQKISVAIWALLLLCDWSGVFWTR